MKAVTGQSQQPAFSPPDSVDGRIAQVENSLVLLDENGQPQWGKSSTLAERMGYYQTPGISIAVIDSYKIDWVYGITKQAAEAEIKGELEEDFLTKSSGYHTVYPTLLTWNYGIVSK